MLDSEHDNDSEFDVDLLDALVDGPMSLSDLRQTLGTTYGYNDLGRDDLKAAIAELVKVGHLAIMNEGVGPQGEQSSDEDSFLFYELTSLGEAIWRTTTVRQEPYNPSQDWRIEQFDDIHEIVVEASTREDATRLLEEYVSEHSSIELLPGTRQAEETITRRALVRQQFHQRHPGES